MSGLWPWLAVAGAGALHGLNPAGGWAFMAARGREPGGRSRAWHALAPVAIGHAASAAAIVALAALGLVTRRGALPWLAGGLAAFAAVLHLAGGLPQRLRAVAGQAGLALWSFGMGVVHGTGLMLVPALIPLCLSGSPAREITASGSLALALVAAAVHMAALLTATGVMAALARRVRLDAAVAGRLGHLPAMRWMRVLVRRRLQRGVRLASRSRSTSSARSSVDRPMCVRTLAPTRPWRCCTMCHASCATWRSWPGATWMAVPCV
jgi:hypothetical protein